MEACDTLDLLLFIVFYLHFCGRDHSLPSDATNSTLARLCYFFCSFSPSPRRSYSPLTLSLSYHLPAYILDPLDRFVQWLGPFSFFLYKIVVRVLVPRPHDKGFHGTVVSFTIDNDTSWHRITLYVVPALYTPCVLSVLVPTCLTTKVYIFRLLCYIHGNKLYKKNAQVWPRYLVIIRRVAQGH